MLKSSSSSSTAARAPSESPPPKRHKPGRRANDVARKKNLNEIVQYCLDNLPDPPSSSESESDTEGI